MRVGEKKKQVFYCTANSYRLFYLFASDGGCIADSLKCIFFHTVVCACTMS